MRIARRNLVLAGILAVLTAANLVVGGAERPSLAAVPLLAAFDPARATRISIEEEGAALELALAPDGWSVVQRQGFPAHRGAVLELLARLGGLSSKDRVAGEASSHQLYGVGTDALRLSVQGGDGSPLAELLVGRPPAGTAGSYVRLAGVDAVYRAPRLAPLEADPVRWLDTRLLDFDPTRVRSLRASLSEEGVALRLSRGEGGRWRVVGGTRSLPPAEVDPLLLTAANLYFLDVVEAGPGAAGLESPRLALELEVDDAPGAALRLGADGDGGRYASSPTWETPWVVLLPESSARRLEAAVRRIAAGQR